MAADPPLKIICDTREQRPYSFDRWPVEVVRSGLTCGDYSLQGLENRISIERKSLQDLIGTISRGRERFHRELARARRLHYFAVVVEGTLQDIAEKRYRSQMHPNAALQTVIAYQVHGLPVIWAGDRSMGELVVFSLLEKYHRKHAPPPGTASGE